MSNQLTRLLQGDLNEHGQFLKNLEAELDEWVESHAIKISDYHYRNNPAAFDIHVRLVHQHSTSYERTLGIGIRLKGEQWNGETLDEYEFYLGKIGGDPDPLNGPDKPSNNSINNNPSASTQQTETTIGVLFTAVRNKFSQF